MNFAFLKSKKVQKMGVLGIVLVIVFSFGLIALLNPLLIVVLDLNISILL